jgi:hypothetical protein
VRFQTLHPTKEKGKTYLEYCYITMPPYNSLGNSKNVINLTQELIASVASQRMAEEYRNADQAEICWLGMLGHLRIEI